VTLSLADRRTNFQIGTLNVQYVKPPFPRSFRGRFHIFFAHARQLHLTKYLLSGSAPKYDIYFVDQLSTCIPILRVFTKTRVLFYCHFPDKLLANGALVEGQLRAKLPLLKQLYRLPMDWLEETTTGDSDLVVDLHGVNLAVRAGGYDPGEFEVHCPCLQSAVPLCQCGS
jgi:hypothetical protein